MITKGRIMKLSFMIGLLTVVTSLGTFAQTYHPMGTTVSMGLIPVYELSQRGGCPYLLAAPSPQWYDLSYRECSTDKFTKITDWRDKMNINDFMANICSQAARVGCQAELKVFDPHDYSNPTYINHGDEDEDRL